MQLYMMVDTPLGRYLAITELMHFWQLNRPKSNMANKYKFRAYSNVYHIRHLTNNEPYKATSITSIHYILGAAHCTHLLVVDTIG